MNALCTSEEQVTSMYDAVHVASEWDRDADVWQHYAILYTDWLVHTWRPLQAGDHESPCAKAGKANWALR